MLKRTVSAVLIAALILSLCAMAACGTADKTFTVDYVTIASSYNKTIIVLVGQYQGKTIKMSADSFKDCTLTQADYLDGAGATLSGTEDGDLKIDGGVSLTLQDASGQTHTVEVKTGTTLTIDDENPDSHRFVLPE